MTSRPTAVPPPTAEPSAGLHAADLRLPPRPLARIELPRWTFVKRRSDGTVDFVSPLPCPYNYGSLVGLRAADGDEVDVLVLGPRLPRGALRALPIQGVLGFVDGGDFDPKVVCSARPLGSLERAALLRFCRIYARGKGALHRLRGRGGETRCLGWLPWRPDAGAAPG